MRRAFARAVGTVVLAIPVLCGGCARSMPSSSANEKVGQIYLEPPLYAELASSALYHGVVAEAFSASLDAPGRCFTMTSIVTGQPEEMVYVSCAVEPTDTAVVVGHLVASESIADTLRTLGVEAARHVSVRRTEAEFSSHDARALRSIWLQLLSRATVKTGFPILREIRRDYFFSAVREGRFQGEYGGTTEDPSPGGTAGRLVEIAQILSQIADEGDAGSKKAIMLRSLVRAKAANLVPGKDANIK